MNHCQNLIQFDTVQVSNSLVDILTLSSFISETNYEIAKTKSSALVPGYFEGSYDDFKEKINNLVQKFNYAGYKNIDNNYYHHILSSTGAKAYADCIRQNSNKQLSAWVENKTDSTITIGVRNGLAGNTNVKYRVVGEKPINKPTILTSGSEEQLLFHYSNDRDFTIVLTSVDKNSNATDSVSISIPKIRKFEIRKEIKKLDTHIDMGAGCNGNSSGCAFCREGYFVADLDFELDKSTLQKIDEQVIGGFGLSSCRIEWHEDLVDGQLKRMTGYAHSIDGNSGHTQSSSRWFYTINQIREYIVEIV